MRILGISAQFHDAAVTVVEDGDIKFAAHSERYTRIKNDPFLCHQLINEALRYGEPDVIAVHEKMWAKKLREAAHGRISKEYSIAKWIKEYYPQLRGVPIKSYWHHETHAAAGVLTSPYDECAVMVIDAIGEFDTASIWHWKDGKLKKLHSYTYPNSLGLFYTAVTQYVGLKPMEDEYILMGMASCMPSDMSSYSEMCGAISHFSKHYFDGGLKAKKNLHYGIKDDKVLAQYDEVVIAKAAQELLQAKVYDYARDAKRLTGSDNLVYMGGVALNCLANKHLYRMFNSVHIMPNPGDAGSSLGAAALHYYNKTGKKVNWQGPYLGTNIAGKYPVEKALQSLRNNDIFGIANGRAEFGPRALGNRSLMADPRGGDIKERLNTIKRRQQFRPFAPVIMEELVHDYFIMPKGCQSSPYMQIVARCESPDDYPAIVHYDNTSRVQTVNKEQHPGLHELLRRFYEETGCPMLLNTSLNIKGEPIVNDENDVQRFVHSYPGIAVHLSD